MTPRLLTRTHYQVDEPAFLRTLVSRCTSPVRSDSRERVAKRLVSETSLNKAAASYAVDLGRATDLINSGHIWTERGHVLNLIQQSNNGVLDLSTRERIFFFQLMLETDGAALLFFLNLLREHGELPGRDNGWNGIANELFLWTLRSYHALSSDVTVRTRLRHEIQKRQSTPFSGQHSGDHQCFLHLQILFRIGLIARDSGSRTYRWCSIGETNVAYLLEQLPNVEALEEAVRQRRWWELASHLFPPTHAPSDGTPEESSSGYLLTFYKRVMSTGIPLCPLRTLIDRIQIEEIVQGGPIHSYTAHIDGLKQLQRRFPGKVHFHVDRIGRPAYIKLDEGLTALTSSGSL